MCYSMSSFLGCYFVLKTNQALILSIKVLLPAFSTLCYMQNIILFFLALLRKSENTIPMLSCFFGISMSYAENTQPGSNDCHGKQGVTVYTSHTYTT